MVGPRANFSSSILTTVVTYTMDFVTTVVLVVAMKGSSVPRDGWKCSFGGVLDSTYRGCTRLFLCLGILE